MTCVVCSPDSGVSGSIYTRWGRNDCPATSKLVYKGRAAAEYHDRYGSGANPLCVTETPRFDYVKPGRQDNGARLWGVRYATSSYGISSFRSKHDYAVPCVVCMTTDRETNILHPGRNDCPSGWQIEYTGYLMGSYYSHRKTNFVCVDKDAQTLEKVTSNAVYFYPTETECGSMRCSNLPGGYRGNWELTCTVCTPDTNRKAVTYTRWGRPDCGNSSSLVYSGFTAGSYYSHSGSGRKCPVGIFKRC